MKMLILGLGLLASTAVAAESNGGQHLLLGNVDVYYGVMPAALVSAHPESHSENAMHGGTPPSKYSYHLLVALFDHTTKQRITNARVTASVEEVGLASTQKKLEPMQIGRTTSYGAYFYMRSAGPYRVTLQVTQAGNHQPLTGQFEYRPQ
ncbi:hypothetical protein [Pseudogulbenkiania sp. MAI-1]|uniref:hypothetical protein n=1 Tax=Pseudogulbenkiania sp. MAI-1 TaxID=990370 RepID=UPI00045EBEB0|nr:hypothetical protein [Pseudogulbenkiania sp. MAI-1]